MTSFRLVPCEATEEMLKEANRRSLSFAALVDDTRFACERAAYEGALSAAPAPEGLREEIKATVERTLGVSERKWAGDVADAVLQFLTGR